MQDRTFLTGRDHFKAEPFIFSFAFARIRTPSIWSYYGSEVELLPPTLVILGSNPVITKILYLCSTQPVKPKKVKKDKGKNKVLLKIKTRFVMLSQPRHRASLFWHSVEVFD